MCAASRNPILITRSRRSQQARRPLGLAGKEKFGPGKRVRSLKGGLAYHGKRREMVSHGRERKRAREVEVEQQEKEEPGDDAAAATTTATKYCVRTENTALGTRVSGAAGFRMSRSARRLYANSMQIPSRRYLYRSHTSEPAVAAVAAAVAAVPVVPDLSLRRC